MKINHKYSQLFLDHKIRPLLIIYNVGCFINKFLVSIANFIININSYRNNIDVSVYIVISTAGNKDKFIIKV